MYNPIMPNMGYNYGIGQQITRVHGEEGAKAYSLAPNCSVLLMDETDNVIWAKVTDGAGFATLKGFKITPIEEPETVIETPKTYVSKEEFDDLKKKFEKLEEELNG